MRLDLQNNIRFSDLKDIKTIYMGSPEISKNVLEGLLELGLNVIAVISNEDRPFGRKGILTPTPVKAFALTKGIPVYTPHRIRKEHEFLKDIPCDLILTMAYGQIVPKEVLDHPRIACLNLHGSILPALRGAAPIQRAIDYGHKESGVSLMEMVEAMDAGDVFDIARFDIAEEDNYTSLCSKIVAASIEVTKRSLLGVLNGEIPGKQQDESLVTFAPKITPEDEKLDFSRSCLEILHRIKALSLTPGAYAMLGEEKLKILDAKVFSTEMRGEIGEIVEAKKHLLIQCKDGLIEVLSLLPQGKKMMDAKSFCNGKNVLGVILM